MFISDSIKTEHITVTPRLAKQLLDQNTANRKISPSNLAKVMASMERNEWKFNGEAIKIAKDGRVLDGQHRLHASVATDTTFETLIVYGLDSDAQDTMDTGKSRTLADVLQIAGYKNNVPLAAITTAIIRSEKWGIRQAVNRGSNKYTVTNREALDRLELEPSLTELPNIVRPVVKVGIPQRSAGMFYYRFSAIDYEDTEDFFNRLASGEGMERGHPILTLRNKLLDIKDYRAGMGEANQAYIAALVIKAWNKYRDGEEAQKFSFRTGGANPETFPEPR